MSIQQEKFKEIADAIREKTNSTDKIKPSDFAGKVGEVYEAGKKSEYDRYWENLLSNTIGGAFAYAGSGWTDETFNPPRGTVIQPTYAYFMFSGTSITDLAALCEEREVTLDMSKTTTLNYTFAAYPYAHLTKIGEISTLSSSAMPSTFQNQSRLHTIEKIILKEDGSQSFNLTFSGCSALENVEFEGTIGKAMDLHWSTKLTHDSLMSIINHLKDGASNTLTLGATNLAKLTDAEKAIATQKGWTLL